MKRGKSETSVGRGRKPTAKELAGPSPTTDEWQRLAEEAIAALRGGGTTSEEGKS